MIGSKRMFVLLVAAFSLGALGAVYATRGWLMEHLPPRVIDSVLPFIAGYRLERDVRIPMRDGVRLATNLYFPKKVSPPFATVLLRLPYGKDEYGVARETAVAFARRGYVAVTQDMRGRFRSEGEFSPYRLEAEDGSDTVDWLASQSWSNGKVGTIGCSALGETQVLLARKRNPHHAAMIAMGAGGAIGTARGRYGYFGVFEGGVLNLASAFGWFLQNGGKTPGAQLGKTVDVGKAVRTLPVASLVRRHRSDPTDFDDFATKPLADPYWREMGFISDADRFSTPVVLVNTWHDQTVADTLALADLMKQNWDGDATQPARHVVIGPGNHCDSWEAERTGRVGDLVLGKNAAQPYGEWYAAMFDYWLRGRKDRKPDLPAYRFYILGEDRWADVAEWPPRGMKPTRLYLDGTKPANSSNGGGTLGRELPRSSGRYDEFRYDPNDPVPTRGGPICCTGNLQDRSGPVEQADVELRPDVLVFTSAPLVTALRIAGPLAAEIHLSSDARDTDLVVKLVDVRPDGSALNVQEGALRMRYRNGFEAPARMAPGKIYAVRVDLRAIAYYFPAGHRIRLQVTSSNFPRLERNLNTGGNNFDETTGVIALNRIHTTPEHPSALVLPEWPDEAALSLAASPPAANR